MTRDVGAGQSELAETIASMADQQALEMLLSLSRPERQGIRQSLPDPRPAPPERGSPSATQAHVQVQVAVLQVTGPQVAAPLGRDTRISTAWSALGTGTRWPLGLVLAVQAAMTLRLVWSNTAFSDEALYLWAGKLEIEHLVHGSPVPAFATYFSGSPVLYPPLGALAAWLGGLAGARLLSLALTLTTTALLHGVTRRLFDRRSAFFAAALYVGLAGTQFLGALATYDAMALCLLALATWLAVLAASQHGWPAARLALAAAAALALANATKYASGLFDPVVVCVAVLAVWQDRGRVAAARTGAIVAAALAVLLAAALLAGGGQYLRGLAATTLDRHSGTYPAVSLLVLSGEWLWVVALLGAAGVLAAVTAQRGLPFTLLACALFAAILLAPAEQARIHTYTSLFKHDDYGAWFGSAVAGYAVASLSRVVPAGKAVEAFRVGVIAVALALLPGIPLAGQQYDWPNSTALIARAHQVIAQHPGPILSDDGGDLLHFYLGPQVSDVQVDGTWYISYRGPGDARPEHGLTGYAGAIRHGYFAVVLLEFVDNLSTDDQIERDLASSGRYQLVGLIPYQFSGGSNAYQLWARKGAA